jgi:acetyltransferase-like isoleucine patch superfamily enzyme
MRVPSANVDSSKSVAKTFTKEDVERSKMLRHTHYNHFDTTLVNERQRCERAVARYNDACKLDSGVGEEEARNILNKVFDPSKDTTHRFIAAPQEKGLLSHGVKIEAPFHCTYGYNIKIMDSVYIGKNCMIDDAGKVEIGARTWIGPNVTIFTSEPSKDAVDRKGTGAPWMAKEVMISSEVVIGANAVIYPGVRLEHGSTVEPCAVVRESLGEFQTQLAAIGPRLRPDGLTF